jgi:hypothetical protein
MHPQLPIWRALVQSPPPRARLCRARCLPSPRPWYFSLSLLFSSFWPRICGAVWEGEKISMSDGAAASARKITRCNCNRRLCNCVCNVVPASSPPAQCHICKQTYCFSTDSKSNGLLKTPDRSSSLAPHPLPWSRLVQARVNISHVPLITPAQHLFSMSIIRRSLAMYLQETNSCHTGRVHSSTHHTLPEPLFAGGIQSCRRKAVPWLA